MAGVTYSTSVFWDIAGLALIASNLVWPFLVVVLAALFARARKDAPTIIALLGALLALGGHAVRISGVTVHSSAANIPLPMLTENYFVYFLFFHAQAIGMALFGGGLLYAALKQRI